MEPSCFPWPLENCCNSAENKSDIAIKITSDLWIPSECLGEAQGSVIHELRILPLRVCEWNSGDLKS